MNKTRKQQRGPSPLLFLVISLIFSFSIHAQEANHNKPLAIGDRIPELELRNVINHSDSVIRSEEWEGKLVILSFWETWCTVCIEQLPKMAALQKEFGDQIMIVPISMDNESKVTRLLNTSKRLHGIKLPFVTSTNLKSIFPYRLLPHEVWIDPSGKLTAVTGHKEVNSENIQRVLDSREKEMKKKEDVMNYNHKLPFMAGGLGDYKMPPNDVKYSRMITTHIPGVSGSQSFVNKYQNRVTIKCTNSLLQRMYVHALATSPHFKWPQDPDFYLMFGGRLIWEARDSTLLFSLDTKEEFRKLPDSIKWFSYEIILPRSDSARINELMLQDLNDYFGHHYNIVGSREVREVECWVLASVDSTKIMSKGENISIRIDQNSKQIQVSNITVDEFMFWWQALSLYYHPVPIINETGIKGTIDLDLEVDPSDFEAVKKAISAYGLEFRLEKRLLDMIVIRNR